MDLATCSDLVTDSMSALGLTADQLTDYLNVTCQANNKSNTTAQALMEAMIGCGGAAKSAGMDYKQTAAALGNLGEQWCQGRRSWNSVEFNVSPYDDEGRSAESV